MLRSQSVDKVESRLCLHVFLGISLRIKITQTVLKTLVSQGATASEDANRSCLHERTSETSNAG